jgi:WD40 repeat protein
MRDSPGSKNGSTVGWDLRSLKKAFEFSHPHAPNDVTCVAAHPLRAVAAVGYGNGDVALFDVRGAGSLLHVMPLHTDQCRSVEFSPNGAYVATAAFDCNVIIAEASSLAPTKVAALSCCPLALAHIFCSNCTHTGTRLCKRTGTLLSRFCSLAASTRASSCGRSRCRGAATPVGLQQTSTARLAVLIFVMIC